MKGEVIKKNDGTQDLMSPFFLFVRFRWTFSQEGLDK